MTRVRTRFDRGLDFRFGFLQAFETESDVIGDRHVREQGVMLEDCINGTTIRFEVLDLVTE